MIGVVADPDDQEVVREFFELFKTPWEFYRRNRRYDVLLCAGGGQFDATARLVLVYAGKVTDFDDERKTPINRRRKNSCILAYLDIQLPLYGESISFREKASGLLTDVASQECVAFLDEPEDRMLVRIGYDLFAEVRTLLADGQPPANAAIPTLELHIALLRNLITEAGIELVEIPPVPEGFPFIACLSHDVDHPSIRLHKWDHTIVGFLYRATFGSVRKLVRGQIPLRDLLANWAAVLKLPLVYMGVAKDFWREFADRYLQLEQGLRSTFFVIPFKNYPGKSTVGSAPPFRAASYGAEDISDIIQKLRSAGHEVGLHGIDAWIDSSRGSEELQEIRRLTGVSETGVRMHWLYFDQHSPAVLEKAGAAYDSTFGYNETVGYRAGAAQVYRPLGTTQLLELPLHVMDTALFYPARLDSSLKRANLILQQMVDNAVRFGGVLTINWHDRSVEPERLWETCYRDLLTEMKSRGAWFSTAGEAVSWFRKRRSVSFEADPNEPSAVKVRVPDHAGKLPGLRLRTHKARKSHQSNACRPEDYVDIPVDESVDTSVPSEARK
jgi:peptidoglycan/xylan/chitin deacetylase (PgdA/CDA1 family)